ncbi:hypothetical protein [Polaromonas sp. A23]|uniref:tetratricopeptide repeat protein n=1 Tax=Polaromonas sp. A23 TaxID=1944133 RepID=UPI00143A7E5B|nr:hypothetical protein [Polaromonas sp. A23]
MAHNLDRLDAEELFSLALERVNSNAHGEAIDYLKRALDLNPSDAGACYLLGAEYAQIGMMDRGLEFMAKAVKLDPQLHTGVFQLGLLYLSSGRQAEAAITWQGLDGLGEDHPLVLFKSGLEALERSEFDICRQMLERGIKGNMVNPALNVDMTRVLEKLSTMLGNQAVVGDNEASIPGAKPEAAVPGEHFFISAYRDKESH